MKHLDVHLSNARPKVLALIAVLIISFTACVPTPSSRSQFSHPTALLPAISITAKPRLVKTATKEPTSTLAPSATASATALPMTAIPEPPATATPAASDCSENAAAAEILSQASAESWLGWVKKLSGADPVTVAGQSVVLINRSTKVMFGDPTTGSPAASPNAFDFVEETVRGWYPAEQVTVEPFSHEVVQAEQTTRLEGKNLILTFPGKTRPAERVILSAHLDSTARNGNGKTAPGADDNASGAAALLEAARVWQGRSFARTVQIVWFTGEEQGIFGSQAFIDETIKDPSTITGVVNLDMFGYDADNDHCFELHVGQLLASEPVGQCFVQSASEYGLGLTRFDYLTATATDRSDHGSFWHAGIGAIEVLENMFADEQPGGCTTQDRNPDYHTTKDTYDKLNPDTALRITRAALATVMALAENGSSTHSSAP